MNLKGIMQTLGAKPGQVMSDPYARAFAPQPTIKEAEDHEVSMAQNQLDSIIKAATELKSKMGENEKDIPAWIQDHITNAENYINQAASNYHEYGTNEAGINGSPRYPSTDGVANESVEIPTIALPSAVKSKLTIAIDTIKDAELTYNQKVQVVKQVTDSLGIDKTEFNKIASRLKGTLESVNEEFKHLISVDTPTQVVSKPVAAQIEKLAKSGVRSSEIGLKMGFVGNQKAATDAFQKVKNQIYFKLDKRNEAVNEARLTDIVRSIVETPIVGKMKSRTEVKADEIKVLSKEEFQNEAKKYDIGSGYMGNGLTIWNRAEEEYGDYKIIAHISPQGKLSIRDKQLPADLKKMFQIWADSMAKGNMGPKY